MFRGYYEHTIDVKGRVSLPSQFRDALPKESDRLVITNYIPSHLWAFSYDRWRELEEKLAQITLTDPDAQAFKRFFVAGSRDVPIDKLGRILIPPHLREYAGLSKDIVFVGSVTHIEIWNKENWKPTFEAAQSNFETHAKKLATLGF